MMCVFITAGPIIKQIKTPHHHGTPRTQSPIHESCPPCIAGASGGTPDDLRPGRRPLPCMRLGALRVVTVPWRLKDHHSKVQSPKLCPGGRGTAVKDMCYEVAEACVD